MTQQTLYNGVKFPCDGPDLDNIEKVDLGALPMISQMASRGMQVDLTQFAKMEVKLKTRLDELSESVYSMTGHRVNVDSGDQVSELLHKKLGIKQPRRRMTTSGDRESVDNEALVAIQHEHPVVGVILDYKEVSKLLGTYVRPMPKLARRTDFGVWRMFPNFGTTRIPSGRLNCKNPNLLAMPNRSELGREVCEGFITDPGWVFLSVDESQIEPRVVAHRSGDQALRNVYMNEEDIYSDFAIAAFKIPDKRYKDATGWHYPGVDKKKHRFPAKTCILASIYEVSGKGLLDQMPVICGICEKDSTQHDCGRFRSLWNEDNCQDLINAFYVKYPGILSMRREDHARAKRYGYVWDEWGRLLHTMAVRSVHPWVVSAALREGGNFPIQSCAQGTVKITMARLHDEFLDMEVYGSIYNPLLQIHDELLGECREDFVEEIGQMICNRFEECVKLDIPIKAGMATSENWGKLAK